MMTDIIDKQYMSVERQELKRLRAIEAAAIKTIKENLHLADGEDCTLIDLKRALSSPTPTSIREAE